MAARVQIPLGVPMKKLALTILLFVAVSCGGSDSASNAPADSDFVAPIGVAGEIAKVVCEPLSSLWQKSPSEIKESFEKTRIAGSIAAGALDEVSKIIKPGITTDQIDQLCYEYINDHNAYSAPLFYRGFPKSCCTSTNHVI
ncbi:MAG: M24 family metallopeptidase, partial [Ilumatobacteraceae bacterium]